MASDPPALGRKINQFFKLRNQRLGLERNAALIKTKENAVKDDLILAMGKAKVDAAKGTEGTVSIKRPTIGRVEDWPKLFAWIKKTGNFEVLERSLHQSHYAEQLAESPALAKKGIPGIEKITVVKFSATAKRG